MTWEALQAQWWSGVHQLAQLAELTTQDAMVLGVLLALLVASAVGYGLWRRRRTPAAASPSAGEGADAPTLDFLAQLRSEAVLTATPDATPDTTSDVTSDAAPAAGDTVTAADDVAASPLDAALADALAPLRLELAALQEQVRLQSSALLLQSEAIRALESYVALVDQQGGRGSEAGADYDDAVRLAGRGLDADALMERTGISATEAELILRLHGRRG